MDEECIDRSLQTSGREEEKEDNSLIYKLIEAASKGDLSVFEKYKSQKDDHYIGDYDNRTPLHLAAVENHLEVVRYLIEVWKVAPHAKDRWGKTAYDEALRVNNFEVADYLRGITKTSRKKLDAKQYDIINAASEGDLLLLKRYHNEGLTMSFSDYDKRTPLHLAAAEGREDIVEFLIRDCKVDAEAEDRWGHTPRDEAVHFNHTKVADLILKLSEAQMYQKTESINASDTEEYKRTLKTETTRSHCIRINIVGHVYAGKTTLTKRLLQQDIQDTGQTNSIDTHVYEAYASKEGGWKILKEIHQFKNCNHDAIAFSEQSKETVQDSETTDTVTRKRPLSKSHVDEVESFTVKKRARKTEETVPTFINIWDFGGEAVFHATHQLFHSTDAIYLLLIDVSEPMESKLDHKEFNKDVQANLNLETIEDLCKYWINTIFAYTGSRERKPPIFLVGTHKDKMKFPNEKKVERAKKVLEKIRNQFAEVMQDETQSHTFLIDNTPASDDEIEKLKNAIFKYAKENKCLERKIPKKWIPLENSLREIKDKKYVTFQDIRNIDKQNLVPLDSEEEIKDFLAYQHRLGSIVYFLDLKLSNHVILDPQWLIDAFKSVITAKKFFKGRKKDGEKMYENAEVKLEVFEEIWKGHDDESFYQRRDILLEFLKKFGVIVRPRIESGASLEKSADFYYIPSLLTKQDDFDFIESVLLSNPEGSIIKQSVPLQFIIKTPILPPSQYNGIVSAIIAKWPILKHNDKRQFFVNRCIVKLIDENGINANTSKGELKAVTNHYGSIRMPKMPGNIVEIAVYGIASYENQKEKEEAEEAGAFQLSSRKCDQFRRFVETAIKRCLERFLVDSCGKYEVCVKGEGPKRNCECTTNIKNVMQQWFADSAEIIEDQKWYKRITERELSKLTSALGQNWEILCLSLGVSQTQLDRINGSKETVAVRMFRALNEWAKQKDDKATWDVLIEELKLNPSVTYCMDTIKTIIEQA